MVNGENIAELVPDQSVRMTLKIWDVPMKVGAKFINLAKEKYGNKSWLLLQDLLDKAEKYDGRIDELERRIIAVEKGEKK